MRWGCFEAYPRNFPAPCVIYYGDMLMLQANGDYEGTARFLETYGQPTKPLLEAIDRLNDVPVDIRPRYPTAKELGG